MLSTKYFRDEKFKDTIKKNSCRLRQKSSVQIGGFTKSQMEEPIQSQNKNENKEFLKNKTIERNKTPKNKLLYFIKNKNLRSNQQKDEIIEEDRQITVKKKASEEYSSTIKQRILSKIKEERNEKFNKMLQNAKNNQVNLTITNKDISKDIFVNRKKFVGSADIKNIIYRNRKENQNVCNTINKEDNNNDKNKNNNNGMVNSMNNNRNNNINERRGIYSLKNINSKKYSKNYLEGKYPTNFYVNKSVLAREKNNMFNENKNQNNENNKYNNISIDNNNEINKKKYDINNENTSLIKADKKKVKYFCNNYEYNNNDYLDKFNINKNNNKNIENNNNKENNEKKDDNHNIDFKNIYNKDNKVVNNNRYSYKYNKIIKENKEIKESKDIIEKENKDNKNNKDNKENKENNNNNDDNDEIIIVHKKESYFNKRYKYKFIKKKEEEKSKNCNDDIQKNNMLNKTTAKPERKINYFKDIVAKRFSAAHSKRKYKDIHTSIKLPTNKSPSDFEYMYNLTTLGEDQNENKKNYYLSTEKPKILLKSSFVKNLTINTGENLDYNIDEEKNSRNNILNNNFKYNLKEIRENTHYQNNLSDSSNLSSKKEKRSRGMTELLKSEKKNNDKIRKINNASSYNSFNIYNYEYVMKMINEAIQLKNSIEIQSLFSILIINFNNKYLYTFDYKEFPKEIPNFSNCYKYFSIMTIPLIFLHKDETIYKNSSSETKIIFEKFIYIIIENIGKQNLAYKKIDSFLEEYKKNNYNFNKEKMNLEDCCSELIKLIFKNYKEYSPLRKATEQLLTYAKNESVEKMVNIINDTILYCFNHKQKSSFYLLDQKITGNRNKNFYKLNQLSNKDLNSTASTPTTPFIRCAMKKNFCLVLDIDETIVHSLNLPFGNYFLLRPGVINFLEELSKLYEIVIFTCSPKFYADGILNKIDLDNNYISHRLYKDHVVFEKGKSVKKLNMIGRDLNKIIFVDNMKSNAKYNLQNLCHVSTWIYDINDTEIIKLKDKLKYIATNGKYKDDIRKGLE